jgi:hypothetical protein
MVGAEFALNLTMLTGKDIIKLTALGAGTYVLKSAFNRLFEYDLKDKTVLITGGSRGLGLVMARRFAQEGSVQRMLRGRLCKRASADRQSS